MSDVAAPTGGAPSGVQPGTTTQAPATTPTQGKPAGTQPGQEKPDNVSRETKPNPDSKSTEQQPGETKSEWQKRTFKLKIGDKEVDREYASEDDLKRDLSKIFGAEKKFEDAATKEKHVAAAMKKFFENPIEFLLDPRSGIPKAKVDEIIEKYMYKKIQDDLMDPKDRRIKELETKDQERERKAKEEQEANDKKSFEERRESYAKNISSAIVKALPESGLPQTPETVKRIAARFKANIQQGVRPEMKAIVDHVKQEYIKEHTDILGKMEPQQILDTLGEEFFKKLREFDISRLRTNPAPTVLTDKPKRTEKVETWQDWQNSRRRR